MFSVRRGRARRFERPAVSDWMRKGGRFQRPYAAPLPRAVSLLTWNKREAAKEKTNITFDYSHLNSKQFSLK